MLCRVNGIPMFYINQAASHKVRVYRDLTLQCEESMTRNILLKLPHFWTEQGCLQRNISYGTTSRDYLSRYTWAPDFHVYETNGHYCHLHVQILVVGCHQLNFVNTNMTELKRRKHIAPPHPSFEETFQAECPSGYDGVLVTDGLHKAWLLVSRTTLNFHGMPIGQYLKVRAVARLNVERLAINGVLYFVITSVEGMSEQFEFSEVAPMLPVRRKKTNDALMQGDVVALICR